MLDALNPLSWKEIEGNRFIWTLPIGWSFNVTALSKKDHNQLVKIEWLALNSTAAESAQETPSSNSDQEEHSDPVLRSNGGIRCPNTATGATADVPEYIGENRQYLRNSWRSRDKAMTNVDSGESQLSLIPQRQEISCTISLYCASEPTISGTQLDDVQYRSKRLRFFVSHPPLLEGKYEDAPEFVTIVIHVQDLPQSPMSVNSTEYGDCVLTIQMTRGVDGVDNSGFAARKAHGKQAIQDFVHRYTDPVDPHPRQSPTYEPPTEEVKNLPVCIIGAGISGLYAAMILDSLGVKYEIVEGSGRIGGRLFTYKFPRKSGKYQYYDVGAMRYPNTTFMKRTFDLVKERLKRPELLIKYIRSNDNAFKCYNDITVRLHELKATLPEDDIFRVSTKNGGNVPPEYVAMGTEAMWDEMLAPLRQLFVDNKFEDAYMKLMEYDEWSVRTYLQTVRKLPTEVVEWFETTESRTGLLDDSLTETVLASLVFMDPNYANKTIEWFCIDGGSEEVCRLMTDELTTQPILNQRAIAMEECDDGHSIQVTFADEREGLKPHQQRGKPKRYSNVISTMSFACLRMVDLRKAGLNYGQKNAIRDLMYTPSVKIGIQWKSPWWEKLGIEGGQSSTDLPIRDVVYPSYGPDDSHQPDQKKSNCMIAAYNGMQDSQRLGGLMKGEDSREENALLDLVMRNLAQLHNMDVSELWKQYEDHHAWDFYRDSFQLGAFCQFGPGQFKHMHPYVTQPASRQQRIHFAGDATSTFHGWVAGALNSAWRAVFGMLIAHPELNPNPEEDIIAKFIEQWGSSEEWDTHLLEKVVHLGRTMPGGSEGPKARL